MNRIICPFLVLFFFFVSCNSNKKKQTQNDKKEFLSSIPKVKTTIVKESSFFIDIVSNGKLNASKKIDLTFQNTGVIKNITVNNGSIVKKGQIIAIQNSNYLNSESNKNKETLDKALLNMEDVLLGFNYSLKDTANIPKDILSMAKSRSGIAQANNDIIQTTKKYSDSKLVAPFSGIIANIEAKPNSLSSLYEKICTLINNEVLFAEFYILENEYGLVAKGDLVKISSIALPNKVFKGKIAHINPMVNENGLILVKARINNKNNVLIDGMNINILIQKKIENVISLPKSAIVDRQDRKVIFTHKDGKSQWNYVTTSYEKRDSIVIIEGVKIGDIIIIEGNVNLAHDTEVELFK
jgi:membrane fusion protein (multidrug efflux system)